MKYKLLCPNHTEEAPNFYTDTSVFGIIWQVIKHRAQHFLNGEGWRD